MDALADVMNEMQAMVIEAQAIVAEKQRANDPVEQERAHLDAQGFGLNFTQEREDV